MKRSIKTTECLSGFEPGMFRLRFWRIGHGGTADIGRVGGYSDRCIFGGDGVIDTPRLTGPRAW